MKATSNAFSASYVFSVGLWSAATRRRFTCWPTCRPAPELAPRRAVFRFDGDKSPPKSGDESPHSKHVAAPRQASAAVSLTLNTYSASRFSHRLCASRQADGLAFTLIELLV